MEPNQSRFFRPYAQWIIAHRLLVAIGILGVTAFLVTRLGNLQMDTNPDLWAPQKHVYVETTNLLDKIFGGRNYTVIGIVPKQGDVYQPQVLAKIKRIQEEVELLPPAVRHNILSFAARKVKSIKGGEEGMEVRPMMDTVPQTPAEIEKLKAAKMTQSLRLVHFHIGSQVPSVFWRTPALAVRGGVPKIRRRTGWSRYSASAPSARARSAG